MNKNFYLEKGKYSGYKQTIVSKKFTVLGKMEKFGGHVSISEY